jgi:hypothetical protein
MRTNRTKRALFSPVLCRAGGNKVLFIGGLNMAESQQTMVTIELEFSKEEAEHIDAFMEKHCYDMKKLLRKWIIEAPGGA